MNLNIPFLGTNVVMSIIFKVNYLSNGKETQVLLTEKEKTIFSLFKGVTLQKIDETYHDLHELPYCYFAKLDTTQDNPRVNLLHSVFDEFLPLYYSDFGHFYSQRKEHETEEITVPLLDKAFNADEKPSKSIKEVS